MKNLKKFTPLILVLTVITFSLSAFAQVENDYSEKEIKQFAVVFAKVQIIHQDAQQEMIKVVDEEGLEVQRYNEIQQAEQTNNEEVVVSEEDKKKYNAATKKMIEIQTAADEKIQENMKG